MAALLGIIGHYPVLAFMLIGLGAGLTSAIRPIAEADILPFGLVARVVGEDCSASVLAPSWSLEHRRDGAGMRVVLDVGRAGVPDDGLSRTRLVKRPFQRCDSRVLTRQLDIETSETRRVQLIAKSSSTLQTLSAAAGPQGENWLLLPG
jgi:hypothetical protein